METIIFLGLLITLFAVASNKKKKALKYAEKMYKDPSTKNIETLVKALESSRFGRKTKRTEWETLKTAFFLVNRLDSVDHSLKRELHQALTNVGCHLNNVRIIGEPNRNYSRGQGPSQPLTASEADAHISFHAQGMRESLADSNRKLYHSPADSVRDAGLCLENLVKLALLKNGTSSLKDKTFEELINLMNSHPAITADDISKMHQLRKTRNAVVHPEPGKQIRKEDLPQAAEHMNAMVNNLYVQLVPHLQ